METTTNKNKALEDDRSDSPVTSSDDYFSKRISSASNVTPSTTPELGSNDTTHGGDSALPTKPLPAYARDFPKPKEEINVKEALERTPGRWTIQGQMEANQRRGKPDFPMKEDVETSLRNQKAAKKQLLESHRDLNSRMSELSRVLKR